MVKRSIDKSEVVKESKELKTEDRQNPTQKPNRKDSFKIDRPSSVHCGNRLYFQRQQKEHDWNRLASQTHVLSGQLIHSTYRPSGLNSLPAEYNDDLSRISDELTGFKAALDTIEFPKVVLLRPTNVKGVNAGTTTNVGVESDHKEGDPGVIGTQYYKLALPNTRLVTGVVGRSHPVLSVDMGASVGLSFNFNGEFELLPRLRFASYRQLVGQILGLVRSIKQKHCLGSLVVLVGFPLIGDVYADLRLLFQLLYTLDFSCYLSHYLNKLFNTNTDAITQSQHGCDSSPANSSASTATTRCLYCSLTRAHGAQHHHSDQSDANSPTDPSHSPSISRSAGTPDAHTLDQCRMSVRDCSQTVNLENMRHLVLGVSEHLSTYQTAGLSAGTAAIQSANNSGKLLNRHSLSSLNIYYNLLASGGGGGSSSASTSANSAIDWANDNMPMDGFTSHTPIATGKSSATSQPFLILPNKTHVFDAKSRHNNILLYRRLKAHILGT